MIIVSASDNNFVPGLLILIYSAWINNPDAKFYVIDAGIEKDNLTRIHGFCERHGIVCSVIQAATDSIASLPIPRHWPPSTYARLFIPDQLPEHDQVLYIDSDAIVTADLSELWAVELGDALVAGVVDETIDRELLRTIEIPVGDYINAGVLVMNLKLWRKEGIEGRAVEQLMNHPELNFADQTAINIVAKGRIKYLDRSFNAFSRYFSDDKTLNPKIIHYSGQYKPWKNRQSPMTEVFDAYRVESGADIPPPPYGMTLKKIDRTLRGLLALRPKYWRPIFYRLHYRSVFIKPHIQQLAAKAQAARLGKAQYAVSKGPAGKSTRI